MSWLPFVPAEQIGAKVYALEDAKCLAAKSIEEAKEAKGTDASNQHDEEAEEEDFSDDEQVTTAGGRLDARGYKYISSHKYIYI